MVAIGIVAVVILLFVGILYFVYDICFSSNKKYMSGERDVPKDEQYAPYRQVITDCVDHVLTAVGEEVFIQSYDGLKLAGKYYHRMEEAPLIIFLHGYRCCAARDGNGIFLYSKKKNYNILMVDQRAHGKSEGKTITFGIKERRDCMSWINWALQRFGEEQKILISGLSMGAATVLMTADMNLLKQVKGIMADCPYSSPKAIIRKVIGDMRYPVDITYWFAALVAKWIGKFDIEETSAVKAVENSNLPILIIHGDDDRFVPCSMSRECQNVNPQNVELVLIEGAGHGLANCVNPKKYEEAVMAFFQKTLGE